MAASLELVKQLGIPQKKIRHAMLIGGGRVSYYLAQSLIGAGVRVKIIRAAGRPLPDACQHAAARLHHRGGRFTSQSVLDNEGVGETDALVTLTGLDEQNVIMSLYGSAEGVPHVITKVNRMESTGMLENLSVGSVVSPKELCCAHIVQYVRAMQNQTGAAVTLHRIADGRAEALEFVVSKNSRYVGELRSSACASSPNILISRITHKGRTILPDGNSAFEMGDTVIVVTSRETPILQFNDIFA